MNRSRPLALASALAAALLANYWLLEGALADRSNLEASWISDLSTRSESSGGVFVALGIASGLALALYAWVLLGTLGREESGPAGAADRRRSWVRWGVIALLVSAVATVIASAAPLSCAEGLEAHCTLKEDGIDVLHSVATAAEIAATFAAFALIGAGLLRLELPGPLRDPGGWRTSAAGGQAPAQGARAAAPASAPAAPGGWAPDRRLGLVTLVLGALWLALTVVTGLSYVSHGVDGIKGAFQRADQIVFGLWLLALASASPLPHESAPAPP